MISALQLACLLVLLLYLAAFFAMTALAARAAGRPVWLFGKARGRDRLAAIGFRAGFALAALGPLCGLAGFDPLWPGPLHWAALPGALLAIAGAMLAFSAQVAMGASWRVGVQSDAVGALVSEGLYALSRNPTFLGQALLLAGLSLAAPSLPGLLGVIVFVTSAELQIRSEEAALQASHGAAYTRFRQGTARWIGWPRHN